MPTPFVVKERVPAQTPYGSIAPAEPQAVATTPSPSIETSSKGHFEHWPPPAGTRKVVRDQEFERPGRVSSSGFLDGFAYVRGLRQTGLMGLKDLFSRWSKREDRR